MLTISTNSIRINWESTWWERSDAAADLYERGFVRFVNIDEAIAANREGVIFFNPYRNTNIPNGIILRLLDTAVYTGPVIDPDGNPCKDRRGKEFRECVLLTKLCGQKYTGDEEFALPIRILHKIVREYRDLKTPGKIWMPIGSAAKDIQRVGTTKHIAYLVAQCTMFDTLTDDEKAVYPKYAIKITFLPMVQTHNYECTALCEDFPVQIDWVTKAEADASLVSIDEDELELIDKTSTTIDIPSSITKIRREAFKGCTCFTSIKIPDSVKTIRRNAFEGCTGLSVVRIPKNVTNIEDSTFYGCTGLKSVEMPVGVKNIGKDAFKGCKSLASIVIPSSVTSIGNSAFEGCTGLESVEIPFGVKSIGKDAFKGCTSLTSIVIPSSVTSIGNSAFEGCTGLVSVTISNKVTCIEDSTFRGCIELKSIEIPFGVQSLGKGAFKGCTSLASIVIPNSVTSIGDSAFEECTSLVDLELPDSITSIGGSVFKNCIELSSLEIPDSILSIGHSAFANCIAFSFLEIPNSITVIGNFAFSGCTGFSSIEIPNSVTSIGKYAFQQCIGLINFFIPNGVMSIGDGAFANCPNIREFIVEENNKHYYSFEGGIYSKDNHTLVQYPIGQEDDSFVIPSLVEKIGSNAFAFSKLKRIDFLSNIHFIGSNAFCHCDELKEIHFVNIDPENITIELDAFGFDVKECTLYVSVGKGYAYRHHPVFSRFKEVIIERYQFQEIEQ